jgi:hypothetical protein
MSLSQRLYGRSQTNADPEPRKEDLCHNSVGHQKSHDKNKYAFPPVCIFTLPNESRLFTAIKSRSCPNRTCMTRVHRPVRLFIVSDCLIGYISLNVTG